MASENFFFSKRDFPRRNSSEGGVSPSLPFAKRAAKGTREVEEESADFAASTKKMSPGVLELEPSAPAPRTELSRQVTAASPLFLPEIEQEPIVAPLIQTALGKQRTYQITRK